MSKPNKWKTVYHVFVLKKGDKVVISVLDAEFEELGTITGRPPFSLDIEESV